MRLNSANVMRYLQRIQRYCLVIIGFVFDGDRLLFGMAMVECVAAVKWASIVGGRPGGEVVFPGRVAGRAFRRKRSDGPRSGARDS